LIGFSEPLTAAMQPLGEWSEQHMDTIVALERES
jgi:hypothetical protein